MPELKVVSPWGKLLERGTPESACFDILANEDIVIPPYTTVKVKTGIYTEFPIPYVAIMKEKSGLANKGLSIKGGVIDSDYRGEWGVMVRYEPPMYDVFRYYMLLQLANPDPQQFKTLEKRVHYPINKGDKLTQVLFVVSFACHVDQKLVNSVSELNSSVRGDKGFGSTGK
jgi:dUTP pyrophosphatase